MMICIQKRIVRMSYATIMVQVDMDGEIGGRVHVAAQLAERFQSVLIGICARTPPATVEGVIIDPEITDTEAYDMAVALGKRGEAFKEAVQVTGRRVDWRCSQEDPGKYIARESRAADLVIVSRECETNNPFMHPDPSALVLQAGRPVLAVPPGLSSLKGRRAIVAWKDTREARRAVRDAIPFLQRSDEVIVVEVCERSDEVTDSQHRLGDVEQSLASHQIMTVYQRVLPLAGDATNTLIQFARDQSADLIVAGAYGHSRLGEWIFGGVTQGLLAHSPVCCLLSH